MHADERRLTQIELGSTSPSAICVNRFSDPRHPRSIFQERLGGRPGGYACGPAAFTESGTNFSNFEKFSRNIAASFFACPS
jgi:hypothetical protein